MIKKLMCVIVLAACPAAAHAGADIVTTENGHDRPGSDFMSEVMPNVELCRAYCVTNRCKAYTFVLAGVQGPEAICHLKNAMPDPVPNKNTVSGIHVYVRAGEDNLNYPLPFSGSGVMQGVGDYRSFDTWNPVECQDRCLAQAEVWRCHAWTWVKPGVQTQSGRCYLKNYVPFTQTNDPCCVSGTR